MSYEELLRLQENLERKPDLKERFFGRDRKKVTDDYALFAGELDTVSSPEISDMKTLKSKIKNLKGRKPS